ncbi:MAG: MlaD family protein [Deltaproteobacteria bacterium]|jgi:phospholipid/cholesterol/gamma-HCH transport system substrate-binding protein/paraquat-inducible protein B
MSARASYFKIGVFVISGATIAVVAVTILGAGVLLQKKTPMETYFEDSVQGLEVGSPVKFRGVGIGNVELITLVDREYPTGFRYVLVRVGLSQDALQSRSQQWAKSDLGKEIEKGLRVRLAFQGLTGAAYLEADYLDPQRNPPLIIDWIPRYSYIPSAPSTIARLSESLDGIMRNLEQIDVEKITDAVETSLNAFTKTAQGLDLQETNEQVQQLLTELSGVAQLLKEGEIESILSDTSATMATARRIVEGSEPSLTEFPSALLEASKNIKELTKRLDAVSRDLPEALAKFRRVLHDVDHLLSNQQEDIELTIRNIRAASENFKELSENAKKYPSQVLFGEPPRRVHPGRE